MDDDVWRPEVVDHVSAHVDLALGPVGRGVEHHARLRPQQLVRQAQADLLQGEEDALRVAFTELQIVFILANFITS